MSACVAMPFESSLLYTCYLTSSVMELRMRALSLSLGFKVKEITYVPRTILRLSKYL